MYAHNFRCFFVVVVAVSMCFCYLFCNALTNVQSSMHRIAKALFRSKFNGKFIVKTMPTNRLHLFYTFSMQSVCSKVHVCEYVRMCGVNFISYFTLYRCEQLFRFHLVEQKSTDCCYIFI